MADLPQLDMHDTAGFRYATLLSFALAGGQTAASDG